MALDTKTYKVTLRRRASAEPQDQFRGMTPTVVSTKLVLEAKTKEELGGMIAIANVDGWRAK